MTDVNSIISALKNIRAPGVIDELELQETVRQALDDAKIEYKKEARIDKGCRVDFFIDGIVLEVKARIRPSSVLKKQLSKYASCQCVKELILVSNERASVPGIIMGKKVHVLLLKSLWGISV
ncbi:MAG: hypothetical protein E7334_02255 [Clostridiales bacterium]|nr:hypothetical protein [Clostridiales bacterium]